MENDMPGRKILVDDEMMRERINEQISSGDEEMLASIAELLFGGKCCVLDEGYEFITNKNYFGTFDLDEDPADDICPK